LRVFFLGQLISQVLNKKNEKKGKLELELQTRKPTKTDPTRPNPKSARIYPNMFGAGSSK